MIYLSLFSLQISTLKFKLYIIQCVIKIYNYKIIVSSRNSQRTEIQNIKESVIQICQKVKRSTISFFWILSCWLNCHIFGRRRSHLCKADKNKEIAAWWEESLLCIIRNSVSVTWIQFGYYLGNPVTKIEQVYITILAEPFSYSFLWTANFPGINE